MNHTPTPWKDYCLGSEGYEIRPVHDKTIAQLKAECGGLNDKFHDKVFAVAKLDGGFERQKGNAKFIVTACNYHDKLKDYLMSASFYVPKDFMERIEKLLEEIASD